MYQQFRPNKFASASLCTNKLDKRNLASYKFVKLHGHMHSGSLDKSPPPPPYTCSPHEIHISTCIFMQGCPLLRIAWHDEAKHEKNNNILIFCCSFCIRVHQIKKKKFSLTCEILHAWRDVSHSCGRFYMVGMRNSVQT